MSKRYSGYYQDALENGGQKYNLVSVPEPLGISLPLFQSTIKVWGSAEKGFDVNSSPRGHSEGQLGTVLSHNLGHALGACMHFRGQKNDLFYR